MMNSMHEIDFENARDGFNSLLSVLYAMRDAIRDRGVDSITAEQREQLVSAFKKLSILSYSTCHDIDVLLDRQRGVIQ